MSTQKFYQTLQAEVERIDAAQTAKRKENVIESFTKDMSPRAVINGAEYRVFNSNDYLGLRHHPEVLAAEHQMSELCGAGPGAVRFISGSFKIHRDLEKKLAEFHGRDDAMVFSSAFATNLAVLFSLITGQSKDSVVSGSTLVLSDALNHRSIIDGIRVANLPKEQRQVFAHLDMKSLDSVLSEHVGKYDRVVVVTDGVFSMLGEYQDLKAMREVIQKYDEQYLQGVLLVVDDCHGVGAFGATGRGTEEISGGKADVLIGTLGKGLGADGGYVVGDQVVIDYLRESAATYIYSNSISPGTAAAALRALEILDSAEGLQLLKKLAQNVATTKKKLGELGYKLAADSIHPIQPILIGDAAKTRALTDSLFEKGFLVTNISYPVVAKGSDEIRVQLSAAHSDEDMELFFEALKK